MKRITGAFIEDFGQMVSTLNELIDAFSKHQEEHTQSIMLTDTFKECVDKAIQASNDEQSKMTKLAKETKDKEGEPISCYYCGVSGVDLHYNYKNEKFACGECFKKCESNGKQCESWTYNIEPKETKAEKIAEWLYDKGYLDGKFGRDDMVQDEDLEKFLETL